MRSPSDPAAGVERVGSGQDLDAGTEQSVHLLLKRGEIGGTVAEPYGDEIGAGNIFRERNRGRSQRRRNAGVVSKPSLPS
jgi:hypothetical protein